MENEEKSSIESLENRIAAAKNAHAPHIRGKQSHKEEGTACLVFRVGTELVAGVAVGMLIGYFLDRWLNTTPLFFLICFIFGAVAGGLNVYRLARPEKESGDK